MAKIGRNQPCPCGSGIKFKKCHGRLGKDPLEFDVRRPQNRHAADEEIRQIQQGLGRPIVGARVEGHQVVSVGNTIYWSMNWKTFPDFLGDYIKRKLGADWGNAEIAKPIADRHPLMQWYDSYCLYQQQTIRAAGEVSSADTTGIVACYVGVAYALYLLDHNVELQERLINRLKNPGNFQGAYYELFVASVLIRAGFTLTLEDETDPASKHCEFAAVSSATGKRYWVEAKMRAVKGMLGRTADDGGSDDKPLSRLIPHLNGALTKPASEERLIFIDLNAPEVVGTDGIPAWVDQVSARLVRYEKNELEEGTTAYVFVTNLTFHRSLDTIPLIVAYPFGLGMPDFNRTERVRLGTAYRQKQKHIDAFSIGESIGNYLRFPTTFDGKLPSESLGQKSRRPVIGETYFFSDIDESGVLGTVTEATVDELKKEAIVAILTNDGQSQLLRLSMTDEEFLEYREFGDAYFGKSGAIRKKSDDVFGLFEWMMETQKDVPRAKVLKWFSEARDLAELEKLSDEDLRIEYCEALVANVEARRSKNKV